MSHSTLDGPRRYYAHGELIHSVVAGHARRTPHATALISAGDHVTYETLDRVSDGYAARLQSLGVAAGDVVPVLLDRSPRLVAVLLAILKCGAAYAALDPAWPAPRVAALLDQIRPPVFVTGGEDDEWPATTWTPDETPPPGRFTPVRVDGGSPASVFFTSGTTGAPKGVLSPHRGTTRLFDDCAFAELGAGSVMPQAAPLSWDAFSLELWGPLLCGGTCVLVDEPYLLPDTLARLIRDHGVNIAWLTSSLFSMFVDEDLGCFTGLRDLLIGGEKLSPVHVAKFLAAHPDIRLTNGYGPAESTVFTTTHLISPGDCDVPDGIPLGGAVANTSVHVLDGTKPCPPGVIGELCVAGDGLATGYLGDPELTDRRFETVEIGGRRERVYRTGDLVRLSQDGQLFFHGRADRQVKIRGRRIEPAEIERAALALPGVGRCAVVPASDQDGRLDRLVLFFTSSPATDSAQVRAGLVTALPGYLVPDEIHSVDDLPLTPNGKLDQRALLELRAPTAREDEEITHADPAVRAVAEIFAALLDVRVVAADASFFALGGSSLDAGRLCVRLTREFGVPLSVSSIVRNPTPEAIARQLAEAGQAAPPAPVTPGTAPLVAMQPGFFHTQMFDPDDVSGLCLMTWRISGPLDRAALAAAFGDVVARHEALRCRYEVVDAATVLAVAHDQPAEFHEQAPEALTRPLDPLEGQLCRAVLTEDGGDHLFGVAVHHLAFDGWSEHLLADDLAHAYRARIAGAAPVFGIHAPGIADVAAAYLAQTAAGDRARQLEFWRTATAGLPDLRLPAVAGPADSSGATAAVESTVDAATMGAWRELAQRSGTTRFAVLLDAFAEALSTVTGQDRFGIGVPVARRDTPVLASAVSCLINTVCVPVRRTGDPRADLAGLQETTLAAFGAQDVPFHEVVAELGLGGSGRHPLYQVMFAYQDMDPPRLALDGCATTFHRPDPPQATCELLAELHPRQDGAVGIRLVRDVDRVTEQFAEELHAAYRRILTEGPRVS